MVDLTKYHTVAPRTLRDNIIEGQKLLAEAGWTYRDGALRNRAGRAVRAERGPVRGIPLPRIETYLRNVSLYGIEVRRRLSDAATKRRNMRQFDFDLTDLALRETRTPGGDIAAKFASKDADVEGSENVAGVKSAAIDRLLDVFAARADVRRAANRRTRARPRVDARLLHRARALHVRASHRVRHEARLSERLPDYYNVQDWVLAYWWDREAKLNTRTAAR